MGTDSVGEIKFENLENPEIPSLAITDIIQPALRFELAAAFLVFRALIN